MDKEIEQRFERLEQMLRFVIRELTYIPDTNNAPEKPNIVRIK